MSKRRIAVIGDGIAANCVMFELVQQEEIELIQFRSKREFLSCTLNSTAMNCLRGTKKGVSKLGDLIVDSYQYFKLFYETYRPKGVYLGEEVQYWSGTSQFDQRYAENKLLSSRDDLTQLVDKEKCIVNPSYFINALTLLSWFQDQLSGKLEVRNEFVLAMREGTLHTSSGQEKFDDVIVCTNGRSLELLRGLDARFDYYIGHSKFVSGSYLELQGELPYLKKSTCLGVDKYQLIFRKEDKLIQIGTTQNNRSMLELPNEQALCRIYENISSSIKIPIPSYEDFQIKTGVRFKGHKRQPFWGRLDSRTFAVTGLYKNGFSFSFLAGKDVATEILDTA